jgi:hypothetical protein
MKITVQNHYRPEYRVSTGDATDRPRHFILEDKARQHAERMASFGQWCQLEIRRRQDALWTLLTLYEPLKGGKFKVTDPYADSQHASAFRW